MNQLRKSMIRLANVLNSKEKLADWMKSGFRAIFFEDKKPYDAFTPGELLFGTQPAIPWDREVRSFYLDFLDQRQQRWFREVVAEELQLLVQPLIYGREQRAEQYVFLLLGHARALKINEVTPSILTQLAFDQFPSSLSVLLVVLDVWRAMPIGPEAIASKMYGTQSEELIFSALGSPLLDVSGHRAVLLLELLLGLIRRMPRKTIHFLNNDIFADRDILGRRMPEAVFTFKLIEEFCVEGGYFCRQEIRDTKVWRAIEAEEAAVFNLKKFGSKDFSDTQPSAEVKVGNGRPRPGRQRPSSRYNETRV